MPKTKTLKIVDAINKYHTGELRDVALELTAYLSKNDLMPVKVSENNAWKIPFNGKYLCGIWCRENHFDVHFWYGDFSGEFNKDSSYVVQQHIACCYVCHDGCTGGLDTLVFGKDIKNVCSQHTIQFNNPTKSDLIHIINMLKYSKNYVLDSISYHANNR